MFFQKFITCFFIILSFIADAKPAKGYKKKSHHVKHQQVVKAAEKKLDVSNAPIALLMDGVTGKILFDRDSSELMHPASMTKMLTAYIVMEQLQKNTINPETVFTVTKNAFRLEGSTSFLGLDEQITVMQLLRGLIIHSGNDTAVVLAEGIAGTEENFAQLMNKKAEELGMKNTHFVNASGLPNDNHKTTAHDLLILAKRLHDDFPEYYSLWSETEFEFKGIKQGNRNPLLYKNLGCDGLKTGSSSISGYGITVSCEKNGRRIYALTNGSKTAQARSRDITDLVHYGFNAFDTYTFFEKNHVLDEIPVWYGRVNHVKVGLMQSLQLTEKKFDPRSVKIDFSYEKSLKAPVKKGDVVGKMTMTLPLSQETIEADIVSLEEVPLTNFFGKLYDGITHLFGKRVYNDSCKNLKTLYEK